MQDKRRQNKNKDKITETRRFGSYTLWISVHELEHFLHDVKKTDSEWQCAKCEMFRIELLHLIHVHGKSSESVQCAITGPCLRMRHRPSA